jgi:hypothetical protein
MPMASEDDAAWPSFETWHDRVVRTTDGQADDFAIDEVYDDAEGRPHTRTVDPSHPAGETLEERTATLLRNFQMSKAYAGDSTSVKPNLVAFLRNAAISRSRVRRSYAAALRSRKGVRCVSR